MNPRKVFTKQKSPAGISVPSLETRYTYHKTRLDSTRCGVFTPKRLSQERKRERLSSPSAPSNSIVGDRRTLAENLLTELPVRQVNREGDEDDHNTEYNDQDRLQQ